MDRGVETYFLILSAISGAVLGSFVNCLAERLVSGEKIQKGRSHCMKCGHVLSACDLFPVASWVFLRGKCRYCKEKISVRYPLTEAVMAIAAVMGFWKLGLTAEYARYLGFSCILMAEALIDLDIWVIPDCFHGAALGWWLIFGFFAQEGWKAYAAFGLAGGLPIAAGLLGLTAIADRIAGQETMGGGDIKMLFVTGMYLGFAQNLLNLIISCLVGILFAVTVKKDKIPFGPAIAASTVFVTLMGNQIVDWYLSLF